MLIFVVEKVEVVVLLPLFISSSSLASADERSELSVSELGLTDVTRDRGRIECRDSVKHNSVSRAWILVIIYINACRMFSSIHVSHHLCTILLNRCVPSGDSSPEAG